VSATSPYRHPARWFLGLWRDIHAESVERERRGLDWRLLVVLLVVAVSLSLQEFYGDRGTFYRLLPKQLHGHRYAELWSFCWWSGWRVFGFLILPAAAVLAMPGERLRDYGWSLAGFTRHLGLYAVLYLFVLPLCWIFSHTESFQRIYPFYKLANRSAFDFWAWELLYAAQFLSLEFFFRGFMLFATRRTLGVYSIWVMVVPYAMIHFGKTFAETMAAIVAGLVLGTVALRTKSIWGGVFVHIAVAVTMDLMTVGYLRPR
jgi:membrane protease YdiL (CAAX protease family)